MYKILADLKIQAMMFDMDIDWETLELTPKSKHLQAEWLRRWKEKMDAADNKDHGYLSLEREDD